MKKFGILILLITMVSLSNSNGITIGSTPNNAKAEYKSSIAIGENARVFNLTWQKSKLKEAQNGIAIGNSTSQGRASLAIGEKNIAIIDSKNSGGNIIAIGRENISLGDNSTSIGHKAQAIGDRNIAIGDFAKVGHVNLSYRNSYLEKDNAPITEPNEKKTIVNNSIAIGRNAFTSVDDAISLGSSSMADKKNSNKGKNGLYSEFTKEEIESKINEIDEIDKANPWGSNFELNTKAKKIRQEIATWAPTLGALSIGNASSGYTRQIQNVAAGTEETDAVNVAQLRKVKDLVDLNKDEISKIKRNVSISNSGVASAMAMSSIFTNASNSRLLFGAGVGVYSGNFAIGLGLSGKIGEKIGYSLSGSFNTEKKLGFSASLNYQILDKKENKEEKSEIEKLKSEIKELKEKLEMLLKIEENKKGNNEK